MEFNEILLTISLDITESKKPLLVAIDGPCAVGKTTLAQKISERFLCPQISVDDFFLPPSLRTDEITGNINKKALCDVLSLLSFGESTAYQPFLCKSGSFGSTKHIPFHEIIIVEGVYALHPMFRPFYQLRYFFTADYALRKTHLIQRGSQLSDFENIWIPRENKYFAELDIPSHCDKIFSLT